MRSIKVRIFHKQLIRRFGDLLSVLWKGTYPDEDIDWHTFVDQYCNAITKRCQSRGKAEAVNHFKSVHLIASKIAMKCTFKPLTFVKSNKIGEPTVIKQLIPFLKGNNLGKRLALSITKLYLAIVTDPEIDFGIIQSGPRNFTMPNSWLNWLSKWTKKFRKPALAWDGEWHATTKVGPNGPALVFAHQDLQALSNDTEVLQHLTRWLTLTSLPLLGIVKSLMSKVDKSDTPNYYHSKLALLPEGGGKTRVIAIADYFTQESMKSLFRETMKFLEQLETDGTYNQSNLCTRVQQAMKEGKPIYCLDLKNATDRFPVSLQRDLLSTLIGEDRANAWCDLLTKRDYKIGDQRYRYGAGQPMGVLTSWSVFALTHHAIIEYAAFLKGIKSFREYVVLGDDVAIFDTEVAHEYQRLLESFGVTISIEKSVIWETKSKHPPVAEIAKRLLNLDGEFTPIPYDLISCWSKAPDKEAITLRMGFKSIGLEPSVSVWETLSTTLPLRKRGRHTLLTTCPLELLNPRRNLAAQVKPGVAFGPWADIDLSMYEPAMCAVLIRDCCKKRDSIMDLHSQLFEEQFWNRFKDRRGEPLSHKVLGIGSCNLNDLHPLVVVINNKLEGLWSIEEVIRQLRENPSQVYLTWQDVYEHDFQITETFVPKKRKKCWTQTSIILKIYSLLKEWTKGRAD